jgi:signal peptidase I
MVGGIVLSALLFAIVFRLFFVRTYYVPSAAMEPSIAKGSVVLVSIAAYRSTYHNPQRYDAAVIRPPASAGVEYIKRVIALPGDMVEIKAGQVLVNGQPIQQGYFSEAPQNDYASITVPPGCYFLLGDNINNSSDSRLWGCISRSDFTGKVIGVVFKPRR